MADYELTSVARVKRRAKEIKRATGCKHTDALHAAAREAGFDNYDRARERLLEIGASVIATGELTGVADWEIG